MLPTKGYFQDIECPYYENSCNRPYCHFRHKKKCSESTECEIPAESEVPTYKPTPKSELANIKNHIPISYVPDLSFRHDRTTRPLPKFDKPTYKPTPLSILSSANTPEDKSRGDLEASRDEIRAIQEIKQNIASVEYNPEVSLKNEINFENLSEEFDMIDDIIEVSTDIKANPDESNEKKWTSKIDEKPKRPESDKKSRSHKSKHHRSDKSRDKDKSKHRSSDKNKDKGYDRSKSSKHKRKDKEKNRSRERDKDRSHSRERDKDKSRNKHDKSRNGRKIEKTNKIVTEQIKSSASENEIDLSFDQSDAEFGDEDDTLLECYKIFNEYKPPEAKTVDKNETKKTVGESPEDFTETPRIGKKRISHVMNEVAAPKLPQSKPKFQPSPAQVMSNRLKLAKLAQADNEQVNLMNEIKQVPNPKRPAPTLLEAARERKYQKTVKPKPQVSTNLVDNIINGVKSQAKSAPKKIAPVANVDSLQRAKARIDEINKQRLAESASKTQAQTCKATKRIAHVPDYSLSDIPDVLHADKSKLPLNVRTRYLTMIADESVKLYLHKEDAYTRALNEEFGCYEKCKVLATYRNSAMLAVSRLRKELQERERQGLGLIGSSEASSSKKSSDLSGKRFYNLVKSYVLSEEELDIHGYPRESATPGQAVIKNRRKLTNTIDEFRKKCARCPKYYLVDEDGFVVNAEECVYHPLKKRTLRGEQTYLCCKSNDDVGCCTASSHVSEACDQTELEGFQVTMQPEKDNDPRNYAVYALDCEMCYTTKGLELTRVTIVDVDCKTVFESLVKPLNPIIDYNTAFSGITKEQMDRTSTSILQVQANILHLCNSKTILIGHSLESDMKALKIVHGSVIDTAVLFPHKMGLPHKRALRVLASEILKKIIQNDVNGHDSAEDAVTCMELVKWKAKEDLKTSKGHK